MDLERLRRDMLAVLPDPRVEEFWGSLATTMVNHKKAGRSADDLRKIFVYGLEEAHLGSVTPKVGKLAEARALSAPGSALSAGEAPCLNGLLAFEEPVVAVRATDPDGGNEATMEMTGLLWTELRSREGPAGIMCFALVGDIRMPGVALAVGYGGALGPAADEQAVFFKVMRACWKLL